MYNCIYVCCNVFMYFYSTMSIHNLLQKKKKIHNAGIIIQQLYLTFFLEPPPI